MTERIKNSFRYIFVNPMIFMPLIIIAWGMFYFFFGGIINVEGGLGYDGHYYGYIARRFISQVFGHQLDSYRIQRILPSFIVYFGINILNIPNSFGNIIKGFQLLNLVMLVGSSVVWLKICELFKMKSGFIWLGFIFWFLNFGVAEMSFYYPVLTDATALFIGFFLLYAYLKDNLILKIILTLAGAFTWANFIYAGIILILFPVNFKIDIQPESNAEVSLKKRFFIFLIPLPFLITAVYHFNRFLHNERIPFIETNIINFMIYPSIILNYLLMCYFLFAYFPGNYSIKYYVRIFIKAVKSFKPRNVIVSIFIILFVILFVKKFSSGNGTDNSFSKMFYLISMYGATKPLVYTVLYINYFGPAFIIFFLFMKEFCTQLNRIGAGAYLIFLLPFFTIFATEARMNINFLPFFILPVMLIMTKFNLSKFTFILLTAISFILSKVYIPMFNMPDSNPDKYTAHNQILYMNYFTISNRSYLFLLVLISIMSAAVYFNLKKSRIPESTEINNY